jgi:hypothetical protein
MVDDVSVITITGTCEAPKNRQNRNPSGLTAGAQGSVEFGGQSSLLHTGLDSWRQEPKEAGQRRQGMERHLRRTERTRHVAGRSVTRPRRRHPAARARLVALITSVVALTGSTGMLAARAAATAALDASGQTVATDTSSGVSASTASTASTSAGSTATLGSATPASGTSSGASSGTATTTTNGS